MDPLKFLEKVGRAKADKVARKAGLNPGYFNQICYGHRRASVDAAKKLVKATSRDKVKLSLLGILLHEVKRCQARRVVNGARATA